MPWPVLSTLPLVEFARLRRLLPQQHISSYPALTNIQHSARISYNCICSLAITEICCVSSILCAMLQPACSAPALLVWSSLEVCMSLLLMFHCLCCAEHASPANQWLVTNALAYHTCTSTQTITPISGLLNTTWGKWCSRLI